MDYFAIAFHTMDKVLRNLIEKLLSAARTSHNKTEWMILNEWFPLKIWGKAIALFLFTFYLLVPMIRNWAGIETKVDTTIWVGTLSLEAALTTGIVAITPWLAKISLRILPEFLDRAIEHGLLQWNNRSSDNQTIGEEIYEKAKQDMAGVDRLAVQQIVYAVQLIGFILIIMPFAIWMSSRFQISLLIGTVSWMYDVVGNYKYIGMLVYNDGIWQLYSRFKKGHQMEGSCSRCSNAHFETK